MTDIDSMAVDEADVVPLSSLAADAAVPMSFDQADGAALSAPSPSLSADFSLPPTVNPASSSAPDSHTSELLDSQQHPPSDSTSASVFDQSESSAAPPSTSPAASDSPTAVSTSSTSAPSSPPHPSTAASSHSSTSTPMSNLHLDPAALLATRRPPAEDDCCVCFNGDSEENDPILFCDGPGCTAVVHQSCYGVLAIPDGDWLCDSCTIKANPTLAADTPLLLKNLNRCMLCPDTTGAFKPTADGRGWVHASCAIWTPETGFRDAEKVDAVIGIETIDRRRWRLVCEICRVKRGSCVQCMGRQCSFSCHVTCGWKAGLRMEMQAVGQGDELEVYKLVYCDKHRNEPWQKANGRWGRGRQRAVRPNDESEMNGGANGRGDSANVGYQCVRCGNRRRQHECKREAVDELMEDGEEEEEDRELFRLWEERNEQETLEERMEREEEERDMERLWESERQAMERDKEEKRRQDRERREKEKDDRLARGEVSLYEELKQAQEEAEEKYALGDGLDRERPAGTTKRRKRREPSSTAVDEDWKEDKVEKKEAPRSSTTASAEKKEDDASADEEMAVRKRAGRPAGSLNRIRKCVHHHALKERCGRDCPFRPPPFTEAEMKARVEQREKQGAKAGQTKRERRRRMEDSMRMTTSAPGQRKVIRDDINIQLGSGQQQQERKEAPTTPISSLANSTAHSPTSPSSSSPSTASVPLSSLNALPPPPFAHPIAPISVVSNPISAPPASVLPPLATSAALVVPRPNAPYVYNARDGAELQRRVQSLLTASTPDQQRLQLKQLLSDSPPQYCRLVTQRLREQKAESVLLQWLREGRDHKAWALIQEVLSALARLVTSMWDEKVAAGVIQEVLLHKEGLSEGCKKEASAVWKRLVEIGWVKEAIKTELKSRDAFTMALQAGQLNGVLASSAAVNGAGGAADKKSKVVKLPAFTNGDSTQQQSTHTRSPVSSTPPIATAPQSKSAVNASARAAVGMTSERYRQKAMQEEAEKRAKEAERKREREFQAGLGAPAYHSAPLSHLELHLQQQLPSNGGWHTAPYSASLSAPAAPSSAAAVNPLAALGALTSQLFATAGSGPSAAQPPVQPLGPPTATLLSASPRAAAQSQVADALQVAAMLQAQLQQRAGGLGAIANLQALYAGLQSRR